MTQEETQQKKQQQKVQRIQGVDVPALGYGTYKLQGSECVLCVQDALAYGYRHIDTAQMYENEAEVGEAIAKSGVPRDAIWLTTKVLHTNAAYKDVLASTQESLKKLRSDYVDLLLLHWPAPEVPLEETMRALLELQQAGAARHIGVSNFPSKLVNEASQYLRIFANQVEYHPYLGQETLAAQARDMDYLLTAYRPVLKGMIQEEPVLQEIAAKYGKQPGQVALRWLIQQPHVAAIPKAASEANRRANFEIFDFSLTADEMQQIFALDRQERQVNPAHAPAWDV